jgi:hypothetical protein
MDFRRAFLLLTWLGLTAAGLVVVGLSWRASRESLHPPLPEDAGARASPYPALPPPSPRQVRDALGRVFGDVLTVAADGDFFCVADLNGDGSEDVAAAAAPRGDRLAEVNDPFAVWTIQDAEHPPPPGGDAKPARPAAKQGDVLLAIVHGAGALGWRDREARQAYLVRVGMHPPCRSRRPHELAALSPGARLPRAVGDVLLEAGDRSGRFLYWTGARYAWYSPRPAAALTAQPDDGRGHPFRIE